MPFAAADLVARYPAARISRAAGVMPEAGDVFFGADEPDGWSDADLAELRLDVARLRTTVEAAIADAAGQIASAIADQYDWSEVEDHPHLARYLADRTMFNLHHDEIPDDIVERVRDNRTSLDRLAKGASLLRDPATDEPLPRRDVARGPRDGASVGATAAFESATPRLRRSDLSGF